ncbi:hypothetical protein [uncultured Polaribacter sp.]|uniref:hypothetical protein n=1 Tax=uncultured Polaribacter sp. TaxID=174711 RepID=UPI002603880E|nr:hypothetical protein [uncultured Polaribacter sp.]
MAEIKIEKKKAIWPWILLVLLALAAIFYFMLADDDNDLDDDVMTTEQVLDNSKNDEDKVLDADDLAAYRTAFAKYSDYIGDTSKMGIDHEYSNAALLYLINAVEAKSDVLDVDIKADLDQARENAEEITEEPYEVNHADLIKNSGKIITRALSTIQKSKYPNLKAELSKVENSVAAITKAEHTLDQKGDVNGFFKAAEMLLLKMN